MTENVDLILDALRTIEDPSGGGDVVATGRAAAPRLEQGIASLILDVTGMPIATRKKLEQQISAALGAVAGISEVRIAMTADKVGRTIIAVGSGKGGVGKSTVSANLAIALGRMGKKVGLVDADIYGPSQPNIMGSHDKPDAVDKKMIPLEAHGIKMLSIGQLVDPKRALAWRGPMATNALAQLIEADWGDSELIVVDLPPGTGDVQLSLIQRWKPAGAVIVSTPQDLALIDARRAIDLFTKMDVPILGLVENMAGYACPHCGEISDPFGRGGAETEAAEMGVPFLGRIPLTLSIREASDAGTPPAAGQGEEADIFEHIAKAVLDEVNRKRSTIIV
ncbi:Mrp/NBP35 family ATP-binding protein [Sphingomonas sp.]|uniref:Mrp/NBP35 family ATP-binding protein n=1 Tax=Sphingomonas sp. TaxID=28214 RepID=UPI002FCA44DB